LGQAEQAHILVINDTQEILDLLQELLDDAGYRVTTSLAVLDVEKIKALEPDLMVQDLLFAGTQETGWHFLTLVRLEPALARIPLILCTAAVQVVKDEDMAAHLRNLGVTVVLKPFNIEDLLETIARVLVQAGDPARDER
jgi:CheY-like chemotaxis protein